MDENYNFKKNKNAKKKILDGSLVLWNLRLDALAGLGFQKTYVQNKLIFSQTCFLSGEKDKRLDFRNI